MNLTHIVLPAKSIDFCFQLVVGNEVLIPKQFVGGGAPVAQYEPALDLAPFVSDSISANNRIAHDPLS